MSKVIAIDRTERHLRYVLAEISSKSQVKIIASEAFDAPADVETVGPALGGQLRELLATHKVTKPCVLVSVGRGALETVEFSVPAAEESELPLLVRNLAMRHLSSITEETTLDFLAWPPKSDGSRDVVAMTVRDDVQQELDALMAAADVSPDRVVVRPYELESLLTDADNSEVILAVCASPQVVDVLLVHPGGWKLARSIRIAEGAPTSNSVGQVVNEIRRTLFSLPIEDFDATHIDQVVLLAGPEELQPLATELGTALDARVQRVNPFADSRVRCGSIPQQASEFAPLLGVLLYEAESNHPIDFLHPRRPPKPIDRKKVILSAVGGVAALVAGAVFFVQGQFAEIDEQNTALVARRNELKELTKAVQPKLQLARALDSWEDTRLSWLDELRDLTLRMPPSSQLTVQRFSASPARGGEATVTFSGESRSPEAVTQMEQSLRDENHLPKTPGVRERLAKDHPVWTFQTTMTIKPRSPEDYVTSSAARSEVVTVESPARPHQQAEPGK